MTMANQMAGLAEITVSVGFATATQTNGTGNFLAPSQDAVENSDREPAGNEPLALVDRAEEGFVSREQPSPIADDRRPLCGSTGEF